MGTLLLHFFAGTLGALAIYLVYIRLSGAGSFSAPFGVVVIGIACASVAHYVSPWATPAIIVAYALQSAVEWRRERKQQRSRSSQNASE